MDATVSGQSTNRPLPALLSQVLVAFTIECDNEFERRMLAAGYSGVGLSLVVWLNLVRFLVAGGVRVRDLTEQALVPAEGMNSQLGCLERWRFVTLQPEAGDTRPIPQRAHRLAGRFLRDGWGSGRGIRAEWRVQLTDKGRAAAEAWRSLIDDIEERWRERFGKAETGHLREALESVAGRLEVDLPWGLPSGMEMPGSMVFPPRSGQDRTIQSFPKLLSRVLLAFAIEFQREADMPLALCANVLRVLGEEPVRVADLPRLTGVSPEKCAIGWQLKHYVVEEPDPNATRGKVARLNPAGLKAQRMYHRLAGEIEERWQATFGKDQIRGLREALKGLFEQRDAEGLRLAVGLAPPPRVVRAGGEAPSLGRRKVAVAARRRARDLVVQTKEFVRDPAAALPHFPLWDMNRGFGP